jgi:NNP family nitrate/nitrite transporter-like MFS transporter
MVCDSIGAEEGPRPALLLLAVTPAIIGIMFVQNPVGFIIMGLIIGFSLATFVACQVWCSQQVTKKVGVANATARRLEQPG